MDTSRLNIVNKKAKFEYHFLQSFEAGIALKGTEVKSIKGGAVNLTEAYCLFKGNELYVKAMFIGEYDLGNINNHEPKRDRKLLLRRPELRKLARKVQEKGLSIVPYRVYFSERGHVKLEIVLAQGKKSYDKRNVIKDRESKRDLQRINKMLG